MEENENTSALDDRVNESFISSASESVGVVAGHNRSTSLDAVEIRRRDIATLIKYFSAGDLFKVLDRYLTEDRNMNGAPKYP
mmetsp:Transcript_54924/g.66147  ORF Transcript_54924/g.66147 Transcript_54924/m.66147 type:complete len:82 (-) Transcript_54924:722-967(-)